MKKKEETVGKRRKGDRTVKMTNYYIIDKATGLEACLSVKGYLPALEVARDKMRQRDRNMEIYNERGDLIREVTV